MKPPTILVLVLLLLAFSLVVLVLAALGVGIGFLLTVVIPSLPLGHAIISGSIIAVAALNIFRRTFGVLAAPEEPDDEMPDGSMELLVKELLHQKSGFPGRKRHRK